MESRAIEGSIKVGGKVFKHSGLIKLPRGKDPLVRYICDSGDFYELIPHGVIFKKDGYHLVSGIFKTPVDEPGEDSIRGPPFVVRYPKKLPPNNLPKNLRVIERRKVIRQINEEAMEKFLSYYRKAHKDRKMARNQTADVAIHQVETHNMDQDLPPTDILDMKEMNSALDNCANGNCADCEGIICFGQYKPLNKEIRQG